MIDAGRVSIQLVELEGKEEQVKRTIALRQDVLGRFGS